MIFIKSKKIYAIGAVSILLIIGVFSWLINRSVLNKEAETAQPTPSQSISKNDKFWVISDVHYLSDKLHDQGEQFQFIKKTSAGKDLDYPRERLEALLWQIEKERPKGLIVSGDLTLNGEKLSAEELAGYFKRAEELGTQVYVIPGNHDISDGWARRYEGDQMERTDQILPGEFAEIFADMGYQEAFSRDSDSLSYAVRPFKDLMLVMIDTNKYINDVSGSSPQTSGKLRTKTYEWLETIFAQAKAEKLQVIPVMHHNLTDHNTHVNKGFTIDQAGNVQDFLFKHQMSLVLTGHIHTQDIASIVKGKQTIYDIATGSFATLSNPIGEISLENQVLTYQKKQLLMDDWAQATDQTDPQLLAYSTYSQKLFNDDGIGMAHRQMYEEGWYDETTADLVADFIGRMNVRYFDGADYYDQGEMAAIEADKGYQLLKKQPDSFLLAYVESILVDQDIDDTYVEIPIGY